PRVARRMAVDRAPERPGLAAVAALEDARHLGAGEHAPVVDGQPRHLRQLQLLVAAVVEALARLVPGLAQVRAAPDAGAVPLARRGGEDRAALRVVDGVVDRPALAEGTAQLPVAAVRVALEDEAALAGSDQQDGLRHRFTSGGHHCDLVS